jgi:hypothetical protein
MQMPADLEHTRCASGEARTHHQQRAVMRILRGEKHFFGFMVGFMVGFMLIL